MSSSSRPCCLILNKGIDEQVFKKTWKLVASHSEWQLGAFIFIYTTEFGTPPTLLSNRKVQFRNEVIHKGKIPTRQEALDYGQAVLDVIRPILKQVKEKYPEGVQKTVVPASKGMSCKRGQQAAGLYYGDKNDPKFIDNRARL